MMADFRGRGLKKTQNNLTLEGKDLCMFLYSGVPNNGRYMYTYWF